MAWEEDLEALRFRMRVGDQYGNHSYYQKRDALIATISETAKEDDAFYWELAGRLSGDNAPFLLENILLILGNVGRRESEVIDSIKVYLTYDDRHVSAYAANALISMGVLDSAAVEKLLALPDDHKFSRCFYLAGGMDEPEEMSVLEPPQLALGQIAAVNIAETQSLIERMQDNGEMVSAERVSEVIACNTLQDDYSESLCLLFEEDAESLAELVCYLGDPDFQCDDVFWLAAKGLKQLIVLEALTDELVGLANARFDLDLPEGHFNYTNAVYDWIEYYQGKSIEGSNDYLEDSQGSIADSNESDGNLDSSDQSHLNSESLITDPMLLISIKLYVFSGDSAHLKELLEDLWPKLYIYRRDNRLLLFRYAMLCIELGSLNFEQLKVILDAFSLHPKEARQYFDCVIDSLEVVLEPEPSVLKNMKKYLLKKEGGFFRLAVIKLFGMIAPSEDSVPVLFRALSREFRGEKNMITLYFIARALLNAGDDSFRLISAYMQVFDGIKAILTDEFHLLQPKNFGYTNESLMMMRLGVADDLIQLGVTNSQVLATLLFYVEPGRLRSETVVHYARAIFSRIGKLARYVEHIDNIIRRTRRAAIDVENKHAVLVALAKRLLNQSEPIHDTAEVDISSDGDCVEPGTSGSEPAVTQGYAPSLLRGYATVSDVASTSAAPEDGEEHPASLGS